MVETKNNSSVSTHVYFFHGYLSFSYYRNIPKNHQRVISNGRMSFLTSTDELKIYFKMFSLSKNVKLNMIISTSENTFILLLWHFDNKFNELRDCDCFTPLKQNDFVITISVKINHFM